MTSETHELNRKCAEMISMCACLSARKASRAITQLFDEKLRPCGIRVTQLPVLVLLFSDPSTTMVRLTEHLIMDRTSLTRLLKPLQEGGLINISRGNDRRTRVMSLSKRGRQTLLDAIPLWEIAQAHVVEQLGDSQWKLLHANLEAVAAKISDR